MKFSAHHERFELARPFVIARGSRTHQDVVVATVEIGDRSGSAECTPYARYGESIDSVIEQIEHFNLQLKQHSVLSPGWVHQQLVPQLPAGAARNAIDCALWRLNAQASFPAPLFEIKPQIVTALTVSIDTPVNMAQQARELSRQGAKLLKVKLDAENVIERVAAVRKQAPKCEIILDANEAWEALALPELFQALTRYDIRMIEQPVPAGKDNLLKGIPHPISLCADESCHTSDDIAGMIGCYEMVNIKLDKTGGLTEAIKLADQARKQGLEIMVGCMVGTSLAMEAALPVASQADLVDLDGPVLLKKDRENGLVYKNGLLVAREQFR
ncbi:muconate cycloisomerase [Photobacterium gaetbulicola]|uniref:Dipeptide epimerase n=1 Tax=Photobacterium gaetbulicola TaxID=1295392 RepID=A0A0B9G4Z6_9GAMM|nr:N-acetyl-D-Glu racemase DgcA [Photobacterium gaetbulicola]KHT63793.1 muconate cycloisomerase [Photobacterium gaetbulicola]